VADTRFEAVQRSTIDCLMKISTILALIGVILAVLCIALHTMPFWWMLPLAVIFIGVAYLVAPN
jgi:fatty acid desaturase